MTLKWVVGWNNILFHSLFAFVMVLLPLERGSTKATPLGLLCHPFETMGQSRWPSLSQSLPAARWEHSNGTGCSNEGLISGANGTWGHKLSGCTWIMSPVGQVCVQEPQELPPKTGDAHAHPARPTDQTIPRLLSSLHSRSLEPVPFSFTTQKWYAHDIFL